MWIVTMVMCLNPVSAGVVVTEGRSQLKVTDITNCTWHELTVTQNATGGRFTISQTATGASEEDLIWLTDLSKFILTTQKMQHEFTLKGWRETIKIKNRKWSTFWHTLKKKEYLQYYRNNTLNWMNWITAFKWKCIILNAYLE